jgi:hypothetical protein
MFENSYPLSCSLVLSLMVLVIVALTRFPLVLDAQGHVLWVVAESSPERSGIQNAGTVMTLNIFLAFASMQVYSCASVKHSVICCY